MGKNVKASYRGHNKNHSQFWATFEEIPEAEQFNSFLLFFDMLQNEIAKGSTSLREAGFAIEPAYYAYAIQIGPQGGDMTIVCDNAKELAAGVFESRGEAEEKWTQIVEIMKKYTSKLHKNNGQAKRGRAT